MSDAGNLVTQPRRRASASISHDEKKKKVNINKNWSFSPKTCIRRGKSIWIIPTERNFEVTPRFIRCKVFVSLRHPENSYRVASSGWCNDARGGTTALQEVRIQRGWERDKPRSVSAVDIGRVGISNVRSKCSSGVRGLITSAITRESSFLKIRACASPSPEKVRRLCRRHVGPYLAILVYLFIHIHTYNFYFYFFSFFPITNRFFFFLSIITYSYFLFCFLIYFI